MAVTLPQLMERLQNAQDARSPFETDWKLNLSYLNNRMFVDYDTRGSIREREVELTKAQRVERNMMLKIHRIERAKILKTQPTPVVLPMSGLDNDVLAAKAAEAYIKQLVSDWDFDDSIRSCADWALNTGNGFFKWWWDSDANVPKVSVVPPFEICFDPFANRMNDARWCIHSQFLDPEQARHLYNEPDQLKKLPLSTRSTFRDVDFHRYTKPDSGRAQTMQGVLVHELWEKPNPVTPEGRMVAFTEAGILLEEEFPYPHNRLPFTQMGHIERAGCLWYKSIHDSLRSLQDELNRAEGQLVEMRHMAQGKWVVNEEGQLEEDPNGHARQILHYAGDPSRAPQVIDGPNLPPWVTNEPERIKDAMSDLAGQHEVSNAGVPGRVEAASAIQLLQEADDSVMQDVRRSLDNAIADGFTMVLQMFRIWGDADDIKIYGNRGGVEIYQVDPKEISPQHRVVVKSSTGLPNSISGKRDFVAMLADRGWIGPEAGLELLDLPPEQFDFNHDSQDRGRATAENQNMKTHKVISLPVIADNHAIHLEVHDGFMKTPEFAQMDEEDQMVFLMHREQHRQMQLSEAGAMARLQAVTDSGGQVAAPLLPTREDMLDASMPLYQTKKRDDERRAMKARGMDPDTTPAAPDPSMMGGAPPDASGGVPSPVDGAPAPPPPTPPAPTDTPPVPAAPAAPLATPPQE